MMNTKREQKTGACNAKRIYRHHTNKAQTWVYGSRYALLNLRTFINDGRTLRAMANSGHIVWPVPVHGSKAHKYVECVDAKRRFTWKGQTYHVDYVDGCFFPFVFRVYKATA
jgi:hypothetical protein